MANTRSAISTTIRHNNNGVAKSRVLPLARIDLPHRERLTVQFVRFAEAQHWVAGDIRFVVDHHEHLHTRSGRTTPNRYMIQANFITSAAPSPIMIARGTITPRIPQKRTRCRYSRGIAKYVKSSRR
jgi:hypothetical protein